MRRNAITMAAAAIVAMAMPHGAAAFESSGGIGVGVFSVKAGGKSKTVAGAEMLAESDFAPYAGLRAHIGLTTGASTVAGKLHATYIAASLVGRLPAGDHAALFAGVGLSGVTYKLGGVSTNKTGTLLEIGYEGTVGGGNAGIEVMSLEKNLSGLSAYFRASF